MITQDNLSTRDGLYARANGVLLNSAVEITDAYGNTGTVKSLAEKRGFNIGSTEEEKKATHIDNINTYFKYLDILAAYENVELGKLSLGQEVDPISFSYWEKTVNNDGVITEVIKNGEEEFQPIFTMLPADEPRFKVNLNTRRIEIPSGFIGQQVQNDNYAETIWFEVDRYFDATDLYATDISIQWENGRDKGVTQAFNPMANLNIHQIYGKIVFGWPLTSNITKNSGNVRFTIRFYKESESTGECVYNLTTLPMNLKINDGLVIEGIMPTDAHKGFYDNLKVKSFYTIVPAAMPALAELIADGKSTSVREGDLENGQLNLLARGDFNASDNGGKGTLSYEWIRYIEDSDGDIILDPSFKGEGVPFSHSNGNEYNKFTANAAGAYGVKIRNYYGGDTKYFIPSYYKLSNGVQVYNSEELFKIPYASTPIFKNVNENNLEVSVNDTKVISFTLDNEKNSTYQWQYSSDNSNYNDIDGANTTSLTFNRTTGFNEGWYKLYATNNRNDNSKSALSDQAYIVTYPAQPYMIQSFTVNNKNINAGNGVTLIECAENESTSITPNLSANPNNIKSLTSYSIKWYRNDVEVTNVNGNTLIIDDSEQNGDEQDGQYICRVTTVYNGNETSEDFIVMIYF